VDDTLPEVRYARSGDVHIAYQVLGEGEIDLVFVMGWLTNLETYWELPGYRRFMQRLAGFTRLILFDKRGMGLSDRTVMGTLLNTNSTWACSDVIGASSCTIVCGAPQGLTGYSFGKCINTFQNFLDGTPCDSGGKCYGGQCQGSSVGGWIRDHKTLVIGLAAGVGSLIVLVILFSLVNRCRMARARRRMAKNRPTPVMGRYAGQVPGRGPPRGPPPGPPMNQWYGYNNNGYPNGGYNAGYANVPPPGPPPRYA